MSNNPNPEPLFCPGCGVNISTGVWPEEPEFIGNVGIKLFVCASCGTIVQEGYWLTRREAREAFRV